MIRAQEIQQHANILMRQMVDNTLLGQSAMCQSSPPLRSQNSVAQNQMANTLNMEMQQQLIESVARGFLPHVCNKNVYKFEHQLIRRESTFQTIVYCKWTFFNDQDMRLELEWNQEEDAGINHTELRQALTPLCDDFEEWQATAIMKYEAGEDVWPRPKPSAFAQGASQQATAAQVRAQQAQLGSQMQSQADALSSGLIGGALGALGQSLFGK